jgi:hypothetical protein
MRVRASSLNYRDLMVLKGGGRGPAAGLKVRIRFPPAGSLRNAQPNALNIVKLSSGSEEDQNILICVKQVALRRQCKRYACQS